MRPQLGVVASVETSDVRSRPTSGTCRVSSSSSSSPTCSHLNDVLTNHPSTGNCINWRRSAATSRQYIVKTRPRRRSCCRYWIIAILMQSLDYTAVLRDVVRNLSSMRDHWLNLRQHKYRALSIIDFPITFPAFQFSTHAVFFLFSIF